MTDLRLLAVDADDLQVLSAHCQDAVVRAAELAYLAKEGRFVLVMNRFVWEKEGARKRFGFAWRRDHERRRAVLHFDRVLSVKHQSLDAADPDAVLVLLALRFEPGDAPSGIVELVFAGGSAIRLEVECIEAQLADVGGAWSTNARPDHDRPDPGSMD